MISFDLLKEIDQGYNRTKDLLSLGKYQEARKVFDSSKALETDIIDLLEDMIFYDDGEDEILTARIKNHLETMKYFSTKSEIISSSLHTIAE